MRTLPGSYHRPRRLEEALRLLASEAGAQVVAGGTDLLVGAAPPPRVLVSLRSIPELSGIQATQIGALTPVADIARDPHLAAAYPVLVEAARRLGSEQIRNVATVGGNLCRAAPCADLAPPLLVLEGRIRIAWAEGEREIAIEDLFRGPGTTSLAPGEILTAVLLKPPRPAARGVFLKKGRVRMDLSLVSVAVLLEAEGSRCTRLRVAAGSVAPVPLRLREVEALLEGQVLTPDLLREAGALAARTVMPITDVRASAAYRREITGVFVRHAIAEAHARVGS